MPWSRPRMNGCKHAYAQIASADEQLARVTRHLSKLEHDAMNRISAHPGQRPSRGRSALRRIRRFAVGGLHRRCRFRFAILLGRSNQADDRPVDAAARFRFVGAAGKAGTSRPAQPGSGSRGGADSRASKLASSGGTTRRRVDCCSLVSRTGATVTGDIAGHRKRGAKDRTAPGSPGTRGWRQRKGHRGAQSEPRANDAPHGQGLRAKRAAQDIISDIISDIIGGFTSAVATPGCHRAPSADVDACQIAAAGRDAVDARRPVVVVGAASAAKARRFANQSTGRVLRREFFAHLDGASGCLLIIILPWRDPINNQSSAVIEV